MVLPNIGAANLFAKQKKSWEYVDMVGQMFRGPGVYNDAKLLLTLKLGTLSR